MPEISRALSVFFARPSRRLGAGLLAGWLALTPVLALRADELPDLGDDSRSELSPLMEKRLGQQIMNEIRLKEPSYLDDPEVEAYLNQIGGKLVAASNDPGYGFTFFAISDNSINAFAMFGGYIGVNTGLLLNAQNESELAGVLSHEISHVTQRHLARQVTQEKRVSMASMLAMAVGLLAARSNANVATAAIASASAGSIQSQLSFSRDYEREADRFGFETMKRAGMDVRGMSGFFQRLQRATRVYENNAPVYLRSHPITLERISDMQNRETDERYRQVPDSLEFQLVRAKLRAMNGTPLEAVQDLGLVVSDGKFLAAGPAHYGLAVALARKKDWSGAETQLNLARQKKVISPMLDRLAGQTRIELGDVQAGLGLLRDALNRYPFSAALRYSYADNLLEHQQAETAQRFLENQLPLYPQDQRLRSQLARAYADQGRRAAQHSMLAELYSLRGETGAAIEQLQFAQRSGDANFYELSVIDARLRELRQRLA
ncbi:MAG: hypothetical protein RIR00_2705, partial [Pseudomonadota bacterium]